MDPILLTAISLVVVAVINGVVAVIVVLMGRNIRDLRHSMNSMRDELVDTTRTEAFARGKKAEKDSPGG